jgi:DNA invertase Pin-like site-specific DNA recombinase
MRIGYARVSTEEQQLSLQLELLQQAGCTRVFQEKRSGMMRERPVLLQLLEQLREGDTVVVWQLDRLARSTRDLLELVERIHTAGARFQSLTEPWADTTSHVGKFILTVFAGLAEFERDLIRERARVGRVAAQRRGVRFGRPPKLRIEQQALARRLMTADFRRLKFTHNGTHVLDEVTDTRKLQCEVFFPLPLTIAESHGTLLSGSSVRFREAMMR